MSNNEAPDVDEFKRRLLVLADAIEEMDTALISERVGGPERYDGLDSTFSERHFSMQATSFACGSPACIVGHYEHLWPEFWNLTDAVQAVLESHGSTTDHLVVCAVHQIICPDGYVSADANDRYTPVAAAKMLRNFVETGTVNWEVEHG